MAQVSGKAKMARKNKVSDTDEILIETAENVDATGDDDELQHEERARLVSMFTAAEKATVDRCIGQQNLIRVMLLSIIAKEHALFVGRWGCNKTGAINTLLSNLGISGADVFFATLDKFTPPEVLLGQFSPKLLREEDRWLRNMHGKLPLAKFGFLGEVFRGNSATRAALHTLINERYVENDGQRVKSPLHTLFCDSNSYPAREEDMPFYDRFLFRVQVNYIDGNMGGLFKKMLLLEEAHTPVASTCTFDDIAMASALAESTPISDKVCDELLRLRTALAQSEVVLSDRRWKRSLRALRANAFLRGDSSVALQDLCCLKDVLWEDPSHMQIIEPLLKPYAATTASAKGADSAIIKSAFGVYDSAMKNNSPDMQAEAIITISQLTQKVVSDASRELIASMLRNIEFSMTGESQNITEIDIDAISGASK